MRRAQARIDGHDASLARSSPWSMSQRPTERTAGRCARRRRRAPSSRRRARREREPARALDLQHRARRAGRAARRSRGRAGCAAPPAASRSGAASSRACGSRDRAAVRRAARETRVAPRATRRRAARSSRSPARWIALARLDAIRPQLALQPSAHGVAVGRRPEPAAPRFRAGVEPGRRRPLAAAQERRPELGQPVAAPVGQLAPARRDPAAARTLERGAGEVVARRRVDDGDEGATRAATAASLGSVRAARSSRRRPRPDRSAVPRIGAAASRLAQPKARVMWVILLEALGALLLLLFIVWWTMFSGRRQGERSDDERADVDGSLTARATGTGTPRRSRGARRPAARSCGRCRA